ncbi:class I SAM-dependent methyltransferase [Agrococcus sp. KRD186]|jgi:SAM-dependent methyltransferase|uniref:class I SAM-dependent methyltransferase n=1 Tax=Agrococcus sp. KRD186 TaxID=2729730 RepID=UPI0019D07D8E|nr:class I SAM-dependent methyltransferase [Agrococcus sp. KRD186]
MGFAVSADSYDRFMGRFSSPLAAVLLDFASVDGGDVLDVGCGPGALTGELLRRGARVSAVDPSPGFVAAARQRHPGARVLEAAAEALPFADAGFDAALAQLVVQFMGDPAAGVAEMARVTKPGGTVAVCVWDHLAGPLAVFWQAVAALHHGDGPVPGETLAMGRRAGDLGGLLRGSGLADVLEAPIAVSVRFDDLDSWWAPFELGVGPPGDHVASLDPDARARLLERCRELLPSPPFDVRAVANAARGTHR